MSFVPFVGAKLKIVRAYEHLKLLNDKVDGALALQPNAVIGKVESDTGDKVYRAQITWQPPREWGLILGDCVHNLRSALDHMVWDLVLLNGGTPGTDTEFPIYLDGTQYGLQHEAARKLGGVSPQAAEIIEQAQPNNAPTHPLWLLRELDIVDKHRTILLTASVASVRYVGHYGDIPEPLEFGLTTFEDQGEILRIPARTYAQGQIHPTFTCDVATDIGGPSPWGRPLRRLTSNLYGVVSRHLHYMENAVLGTSPADTSNYPHLSDTAPSATRPPDCRVVEPD